MGSQFKQETLETCDGIDLYSEFLECPSPLGVAIIVHGYGEHSGIYRSFCQELNSENFNTLTYDLRGHGKSPGERGDITSLQDCLDDLDLAIARVQDRFQGLPIFLFGHNLGSSIVALHCAYTKASFAGTVLTHIPFDIESSSTQRVMKPLLKLFSPIESTYSPQTFPGVDSGEDELMHNEKLSIVSTIELDEAHNYLLVNGDRLTHPLYVVASGAVASTHKEFFDGTYSYQKEFKRADHHLSQAELKADLIPWVKARLNDKPFDDDEAEEGVTA